MAHLTAALSVRCSSTARLASVVELPTVLRASPSAANPPASTRKKGGETLPSFCMVVGCPPLSWTVLKGIAGLKWQSMCEDKRKALCEAGKSDRSAAAAHLKADDVLALGVATRDLDGVVDGLAPAVGEEEPREARRGNLQQPVQQAHLLTTH